MRFSHAFFLIAALLLGACANNVEMPTNPEGIDEMRISPCVCNEIDYKGPEFTWLG